MAKSKIKVIDDEEEIISYSAIARLVNLGRKKGYVTIDDIMKIFPNAEQDVGELEEAFASLMSAGIPYIEDDENIPEPSEEELIKDEEKN